MSWLLVLCYAITAGLTRIILQNALPGTDNINELSFVLTTITIIIASVSALWIVRRRPTA